MTQPPTTQSRPLKMPAILPSHANPGDTSTNDGFEHARSLHLVSEDVMWRRLDSTGPYYVLDLISVGFLPPQIAEALGVRIAVLDQWMRANLDPSSVVAARRAAASRFRARATAVIAGFTPATEDGTVLKWRKQMRDEYLSLATAMDPGEWNPQPANAGTNSVANVTINMADPYAFGGVSTQQAGAPPPIIDQRPTATPNVSSDVNLILQALQERQMR